jgi:hypothetical protein
VRSSQALLVAGLIAAFAAAIVPATGHAQVDDPFAPGAGGRQPGAPPKEEEYVRPKEALEPLPEPLSAEEERARERAKERGVLVSDKPKAGFISEVRIEGARKIEPDAVLVQVQSRIDKKPDVRTIQADIRRIYAMDIFDDVVVETRPGKNDSVVLTFRLKEKPAVDEVLIEGNKDVSKEDIEEVIDIKPSAIPPAPPSAPKRGCSTSFAATARRSPSRARRKGSPRPRLAPRSRPRASSSTSSSSSRRRRRSASRP